MKAVGGYSMNRTSIILCLLVVLMAFAGCYKLSNVALPDGLKNILNTFRECEKNRLVVLFGCGGDRDKSKRAEMGEIAGRYSDFPRPVLPLS